MKFAKELDDNAIPEWKDKYFDYKGAKKKLKAVGKAVRNVNRSSPLARRTPVGNSTSLRDSPFYSFLNRDRGTHVAAARDDNGQHPLRTRSQADSPRVRSEWEGGSTPIAVPHERSPLRSRQDESATPRLVRYGSIIGSPPSGNSPLPELTHQKTQASLLELPDPALDPLRSKLSQNKSVPAQAGESDDERPVSPGTETAPPPQSGRIEAVTRQLSHNAGADQVSKTTDVRPSAVSRYGSFTLPKLRTASTPDAARPPFLRRVLSIAGSSPLQRSSSLAQPKENGIALEAYRQVDFKQAEFFFFLDKQFDKIEHFYKVKEQESTARLELLRGQLHMLRNRRLEDIVAAEQKTKHAKQHGFNGVLSFAQESLPFSNGADHEHEGAADTDNGAAPPEADGVHNHRWASVSSQVDNALDKIRTGHVGKTSKAMEELGTPSNSRVDPDIRDYQRRPTKEAIPSYRNAKRRLKIALQEYYRGLELLKSYALLNRTAFRKINKKFDKTIHAPSGATMRYMSDKVDKAHFVNSDIIDRHIQLVEDLYARYFERGKRKIAVGKLRGKALKLGDYTGSLFRAGLFLGSGIALGIIGLVYGALDLFDPDPIFQTHSSYLLQIYAGYFLFLLLVGLFCIDARIFSRAKVNYQFVFEFDARHVLDWRQLTEIPSVFLFLLGLTMYLNFSLRAGGDAMYIYWPVVLIGIAVILMCLPPRLFYWDSRKWFLYSLWRLLWPLYYPVEFRDFFLGDMFCSETYAMGNIELFFCLYAGHWNNPPVCNSSNSRLLGFLSTLPGIVRALQCIKRYKDTRNWFPHLANCAKYICTISMYMSLSLFRIQKTDSLKILFIFASTINSCVCIFWDIFMDWSLARPGSKHPFLRNTLAFKRHSWCYYLAMTIDPILRFNWIFYAIFADDLQHSSIISFAVALSEVCRRGVWTVFRIENEHCTNVSRNRVVRDVELPYQRTTSELLDPPLDGVPADAEATRTSARDEESAVESAHTTATEQQLRPETVASSAAFLRQRRQTTTPGDSPVAQALRRVGTTVATAHAQDYERKRRPMQDVQEEQDSDEDDDEDDEDTAAAEEMVDRAR